MFYAGVPHCCFVNIYVDITTQCVNIPVDDTAISVNVYVDTQEVKR